MTTLTESEHQAQAALFAWAKLMRGRYPELNLLFAIPNAGKRTVKMGAWYKAEGLRRGVPDICLPVARNGWHGLYVELKVGRNTPTDEQETWLAALEHQGYCAQVAYGSEAAVEAVASYLGIDLTWGA